jgi:hypothetical protein
VPHDGDDIDGLQFLPQDGEQFKANREKAFAFDKRIAAVKPHVRPRPQDAVNLADDLLHRLIVFRIGRVELADAAGIVGVVNVRRVRRIDENKIGLFVFQRQLAGIDAKDVLARRRKIISQRSSA